MLKQSITLSGHQPNMANLEEFFIMTGFYDLLPLALEMAEKLGFDQTEMTEAISKVNDKYYEYPPTKNRTAWFRKVYEEKLQEARGDILAHQAKMKFLSRRNNLSCLKTD
jgi:hypothetical protein